MRIIRSNLRNKHRIANKTVKIPNNLQVMRIPSTKINDLVSKQQQDKQIKHNIKNINKHNRSIHKLRLTEHLDNKTANITNKRIQNGRVHPTAILSLRPD